MFKMVKPTNISNVMDLEKHRVNQNDTALDFHSSANNCHTTVNGSPFHLLSRQPYWISPNTEKKEEKRRDHQRRGGCWSCCCPCCSPCCCIMTGILLALFLSGLAALIGALIIITGKSTTLTSRSHSRCRLLFCFKFVLFINSDRNYKYHYKCVDYSFVIVNEF